MEGRHGEPSNRDCKNFGAFSNRLYRWIDFPVVEPLKPKRVKFLGSSFGQTLHGYSGFIEERPRLISRNFLSSGEGPSNTFLGIYSAVLGQHSSSFVGGCLICFLGFASLPRESRGALIPTPICIPLSINKKSTRHSFWVSSCGLIACYCFMVFLSILFCIFIVNFPYGYYSGIRAIILAQPMGNPSLYDKIRIKS